MQLYVGNIPLNATDADLRQLFADYGKIATAVVSINGETDRSLGFGLVELADHGMAHEAVQRLNGSTWNGRTLIVSGGALSKDDE
jgi:RNA recognition motif-containing protein